MGEREEAQIIQRRRLIVLEKWAEIETKTEEDPRRPMEVTIIKQINSEMHKEMGKWANTVFSMHYQWRKLSLVSNLLLLLLSVFNSYPITA